MNLHIAKILFLLASAFPSLLRAETFVCNLDQDCELGEACVALSEPQSAWLSGGDEGVVDWEMSGNRTAMTEVVRSETAVSYVATPSPNNAIMLTLHSNSTTALTVHYVSPTAFFSNTMRGNCLVEPE